MSLLRIREYITGWHSWRLRKKREQAARHAVKGGA